MTRFSGAVLLLSGAVGCGGVAKEMYDARGTQIDKVQADLAKQKADPDKAQSDGKLCGAARAADNAADDRRVAEVQARADRRRARYQELVDKLQSMAQAGKLSVEVRDGLMVVKMPAHILFDPGKVDIKPEGRQALKELAKPLAGIADRRYQVAAHTDSQPLGKGAAYGDNWSPSTARGPGRQLPRA